MRFYEACIRVAEQIETILTDEQREIFTETELEKLFLYHFSLGMWIRHHCLAEDTYLYQAFRMLGYGDQDAMSMYLLEITQQYLKLKRAQLL